MSRRRGFTLIELLAVSGMVTLFFAQLLPAIQDAREAARRSKCKNNLKLIGLALHNYHDTFGQLPLGWDGADLDSHKPDALGMNGWGWGTRILPYIDQAPLYSAINFNVRVDDSKNAKLITQQIDNYRCPSDPYNKKTWMIKDDKDKDLVTLAVTNYVGSFGTEDVTKCEKSKPSERCDGNGVFSHNIGVTIRDVTDGIAYTLAVGERVGNAKTDHFATWSGVVAKGKSPFSRILGSSDQPLDTKKPTSAQYLSAHPKGTHFSILDGSVRFLNLDTDLKVLQALTTRAGGEDPPKP